MTERPLADAWEAQAREWARWARTPGHDRHFHLYNWPAFLALLPPPGRATLDLGCGEGRGGVALGELGHRMTGVDLAPTMARLARETGAYTEVLHADAAALPFADGAFDLVVAFMALHDMDDAAGALHEAWRVLEPGGRLVMAVVHPFAAAHPAYFETRRLVDTVERDGVTVDFHQLHRPLADWFAILRDAGYLVEDLREPRPAEADAARDASFGRARSHPLFVHLRCVKPGARRTGDTGDESRLPRRSSPA